MTLNVSSRNQTQLGSEFIREAEAKLGRVTHKKNELDAPFLFRGTAIITSRPLNKTFIVSTTTMVAAAAAICDAVLPSSLKLAQLQRVAFLCGLATSGTKADIRKLITDAAANASSTPAHPKASRRAGIGTDNRRILSVDLGLRNLAYSLLVPAPTPLNHPGIGKLTGISPPPVHLHVWTRKSLVKASSPADEGKEKQKLDAFSPTAMAVTAVHLVRQTLLPLNPTHVLIERQRFRTGGAAPVQEWTLRVNTLEAMMHATFRTLRECGHWDGEVVSVAPSRVGPFWLDGRSSSDADNESGLAEEEGGVTVEKEMRSRKRGQKAKLNMKKEKIDILGNWLEEGNVVLPQNRNVEAMIQTYFERWRRTPRARKLTTRIGSEGGEDEVVTKIDDLADSLLQGLAWVKWEENKANLKSQERIIRLLGP